MPKRAFSNTSGSPAPSTYSNVSSSSSRPIATLGDRRRPSMINRPQYLGGTMPMISGTSPIYQPIGSETTQYVAHSESDQGGDNTSDGYHISDHGINFEDDFEELSSQSYNNKALDNSRMNYLSQSDAGTEVSANTEPRKDGSRRPPVFSAHTYSLGMQAPGFESGEAPSMVEKKRRKLLERRGCNKPYDIEGGEGVRHVSLVQSGNGDELPGANTVSPSDTAERRSTNKMPQLVDADSLPDSYFHKNNMMRPPYGSDMKLPKRTCGANDPENIQIVNLREQKDWPFKLIKDYLNAQRVKNGLNPSFTDTSVANRYNRTAPLLFAAAGLDFVPLSERKKGGQAEQIQLTDEMNDTLVAAVKLVDSMKWNEVSRLFSSKHGIEMDPLTLARAYASYMK